MALSDMAARKAKPAPRPYKLYDGGGLFLHVQPGGSKLWRVKYRYSGREKLLALGAYPLISLADARKQRDAIKRALLEGIDPSAKRREDRAAAALRARNTFEAVAEEYLAFLADKQLAAATMRKHRWLLTDMVGSLARRPLMSISSGEILDLLRKIERSGRRETAKKLRADISGVFRLAMVTDRATSDPTAALKGMVLPPRPVPRPAITDEREFGAFLSALEAFSGWPTLKAAIKFQILTCARPGEVRLSRRAEFDRAAAVWRVPAERMKMRRPHEVPLSRQALQVLDEIWPYSRDDGFVFPSIRSNRQALSENAFNAAIRRMGYSSEEVTAHGFRATASTILNTRGYDAELIEAALAHQDENAIRRIYNRSTHWARRKVLMQDWADLLDLLQAVPQRPTVDDELDTG
jgi:integrase